MALLPPARSFAEKATDVSLSLMELQNLPEFLSPTLQFGSPTGPDGVRNVIVADVVLLISAGTKSIKATA